MNLNINKIQIQKAVFTASMEQSISVLLLPYIELSNSIEQEVQNNPMLEAEYQAETPQDSLIQQVDWKRLETISNLSIKKDSSNSFEEMNENIESPTFSSMVNLEDYLLQQLFWEISDPIKRKIGEFIIGNLDSDGYLSLTCQEIAKSLNIPNEADIKEVLGVIQSFDPIGIAAKDLKESLIIQINNRQSSYKNLAIAIVESSLEDLSLKRYALIAKKLSTDIENIYQAAELISQLDPKPAQSYRPVDPGIYIYPDLFIRKDDSGEYIVETNKKRLPMLRINKNYKDLLQQPNLPSKDYEFIKEKLNNALNFIKSIEQRGETLVAIAQFILKHQKRFFEGEESVIVPLALKDIAVYLDRNESTISRAIHNKYVDTPQGLFPLKFFFSHRVACENNEEVSSHSVKEELMQIVEEENKESPLSDQEIHETFETKGIHLARRTITKYRKLLKILPSHLRKSTQRLVPNHA